MSLGLLSHVAWASGLLLVTMLQTCSRQPILAQRPVPQPTAGAPPVSSNSAAGLSPAALEHRARAITVKILLLETWGSGILVYRQGQRYLVLTNEHVVTSGQAYRIQTPDGQVYAATAYRKTNFQGNDLALLEFSSTRNYTIARLGNSRSLKVGSAVFATGFPLSLSDPRASVPNAGPNASAILNRNSPNAAPNSEADSQPGRRQDGFQFTQGRVSLLNSKPFEGGYQLGYSNPIVKGMSGGPVLNAQGVVVGINGMQAYPLWGNPYVFQDGTQPPAKQIDLLTRSSWAIPVETFLNLAPESVRLAQTRSIALPAAGTKTPSSP